MKRIVPWQPFRRLGGTLKDVTRRGSISGLLYGREPSQLMFALHKKLTRFQNGYFKGMVSVNLIVQSVLDFCGMYCNKILFTHQRLILFGNIKEQYTCEADRYASSGLGLLGLHHLQTLDFKQIFVGSREVHTCPSGVQILMQWWIWLQDWEV